MKKTALLINFYSHFLISSIVINLWCFSFFFYWGLSVFFPLFWFKMATLAITALFINKYRSNHFYFYKNLGVQRWQLWAGSLGFDCVLFILLTIITLKLR